MKTASETLKAFEDDREYHFHELDRDWIIQAMETYASQFRPFSSSGEAAVTDEEIEKIKQIAHDFLRAEINEETHRYTKLPGVTKEQSEDQWWQDYFASRRLSSVVAESPAGEGKGK